MAEQFIIRGGKPLSGEIKILGSKNAATKIMVASLLTSEPCVLTNVPLSEDISITAELCRAVGSRIEFINHTCQIETRRITTSLIPELSRRNRIPILALGPLLHRQGFAEIPVLGGCPIGHRPINLHIEALNRMGAKIERREKSYYAEAKKLRGTKIELLYPSVGATENIILAATLSEGKTEIRNAAVEPEILNLADVLISMGAKIKVAAEQRLIEIEGVKKLTGFRAEVIPDRNEIVSFAVAALATRGEILILETTPKINLKNFSQVDYLDSFLEKTREIGGAIEPTPRGLRLSGQNYQASFVETAPHPAFMTDWQQPFCVLLTQAQGESIIHETVYEDRFGYTKDLKRMGAKIAISDECPPNNKCRFAGQTFNHTARISGSTKLHGENIVMTDIRAGMAHIIAALTAEGESKISGIEHTDRGYEKLDERLREIGAEIKRV